MSTVDECPELLTLRQAHERTGAPRKWLTKALREQRLKAADGPRGAKLVQIGELDDLVARTPHCRGNCGAPLEPWLEWHSACRPRASYWTDAMKEKARERGRERAKGGKLDTSGLMDAEACRRDLEHHCTANKLRWIGDIARDIRFRRPHSPEDGTVVSKSHVYGLASRNELGELVAGIWPRPVRLLDPDQEARLRELVSRETLWSRCANGNCRNDVYNRRYCKDCSDQLGKRAKPGGRVAWQVVTDHVRQLVLKGCVPVGIAARQFDRSATVIYERLARLEAAAGTSSDVLVARIDYGAGHRVLVTPAGIARLETAFAHPEAPAQQAAALARRADAEAFIDWYQKRHRGARTKSEAAARARAKFLKRHGSRRPKYSQQTERDAVQLICQGSSEQGVADQLELTRDEVRAIKRRWTI